MKREVLLELVSGQVRKAWLDRDIDPDIEEVEVLLGADDPGRRVTPAQVCCICIKGGPLAEMTPEDDLEEVEIISGKVFHVRINPKLQFKAGFYGYSITGNFPYKLIYFFSHCVRQRHHFIPLGEMLENKGLVSRDALEEALLEQRQLKERRVGEILSKNVKLDQKTIDTTIRKAQKLGSVPPRARVGDILVAAGLVTKQEVEEALANQVTDKKKKLGTLLVERGLVTEEQMLAALATKFRMRFVDLDTLEPTAKALSAISREIAFRLRVIAIEERPDRLVVATSDPVDPGIGDALHFHTGRRVELVVATSRQIGAAIEKYYGGFEDQIDLILGDMAEEPVDVIQEQEEGQVDESDSQIIRLVNNILIDAYKKKASDIHLEPGAGTRPLGVRYRIDGICRAAHVIPAGYKRACIARIKVLANLNLTERRHPQSGKILLRYNNRNVEYRVETTPTTGGQEDAVLRVLSSSKPLPLSEMGFSERNLRAFTNLLSRPYGIILCVGPTGSGKTTTLHSALAHINTPDRKIWTAEDPVEITQAGLRQVQVQPKIGFTFQEALRSFLRADPDVIMIGEMRDTETAEIAIRASLTGHLVFSTLHTNTAAESAVRLIDMGLDPFNFAEGLLGILAQRLVRRLCEHCREPYHPDQEEFDRLVHAYGREWYTAHQLRPYDDTFRLMRATGCRRCNQAGYAGRLALHELLVASPEIKRALKNKAAAEELQAISLHETMKTLKMDGIEKVLAGVTDFDQVLKVCL